MFFLEVIVITSGLSDFDQEFESGTIEVRFNPAENATEECASNLGLPVASMASGGLVGLSPIVCGNHPGDQADQCHFLKNQSVSTSKTLLLI